MRAKAANIKRVEGDVRYNSLEVAKLINRAMNDGKKEVSQKQVYKAMDIIAQKTGAKALDVLMTALNNIKPKTEVRSRRIGGAAYQVPMPVSPRRQFSISIRWLIEFSNKRSNSEYHTYGEKLAAEIMDAYNGQGATIKKRDDVHRQADANKAFAHFRW